MTSGNDLNADNILSEFKLHVADERDHKVYLHAQQILDGNEVKFQMVQSLARVGKILASFNRGERFRDMYSYGSNGTQGDDDDGEEQRRSNNSNESTSEELREIVRVLLKELQVQSDNAKENERAEHKRMSDLRQVTEECAAMKKAKDELQRKYDDLFAEKVLLQKEVTNLETTVEKMRSSMTQRFSKNASSFLYTQNSFGGPPVDSQVHDAAAAPHSNSAAGSGGGADEDFEEEETPQPIVDLFPVMPVRVPTGDVTIVCTGIHKVDTLWELFPQEMPLAIALHNRLMHEAILEFDGYEVKTSGTDYMAVFQEPRRAVDFAAHVQLVFAQQHWPNRFNECPLTCPISVEGLSHPLWNGLRVRIGVHRGPAHVEANPQTGGYDYMGVVVNKAVLLRRMAFGGMACVSKDVYQLVVNESLPTAGGGDASASSPGGGGGTVSVSYAETLRRRSTIAKTSFAPLVPPTSATSLASCPTLKLSLTYHACIPATSNTPASDVYCLLPVVLEERLTSIRRSMQECSSGIGLSMSIALDGADMNHHQLQNGGDSSPLTMMGGGAAQTGGGAPDPSDLEMLLGNFATSEGQMFATGDGVADLASLDSESISNAAMEQAQLPDGNVSLLALRVETMSNQRFLEKAPDRDVRTLLEAFWNAIQIPISSFGGKLYYRGDDLFMIAFRNPTTALRCALAIDAELTAFDWPELALSYKETSPVVWRKQKIFAGLRSAMGVHAGNMNPHYDPLSKAVGYVGPDAFMAMRLARIAKAGQVLLVERIANDVLLQMQPSPPFFMNVVSGRSTARGGEDATELLQLVSASAKSFIGRYFTDCGLVYPNCRRDKKYRHLREKVLTEMSSWQRRATMMMPRDAPGASLVPQLSMPNSPSSPVGTAAIPVASVSGPEQDFSVGTALAVVLLDCLRKQCLPEASRDAHIIVTQLENIEHNRMLIRDTFYQGQPVAYRPVFADLGDLRELSSYFDEIKRQRDDAMTGGDDGDGSRENSEPSSRVGSARRRPSSGGHGAFGRDSLFDAGSGTDIEDDEMAQSGTLINPTSLLIADQAGNIDLKQHDEQVRLELLVSHKVIRTLLVMMKQWMEPLFGENIQPQQYVLSDEEIVSKIIHFYRTSEEDMLGKKTLSGKSNSEQWRRITGSSLEENAEDGAATRRLCRSLVGLACKHFLFLRQFVKRVKMNKPRK